MITAAMTISSAAEAVLRGDALVLGDRHQAGERRAERRDQVGADAHPVRRDAGIDRRLLVAAGGEGLVAPAGLGEHERADRRRRRRRSTIWLLKPQALVSPSWKKQRILLRLGRDRRSIWPPVRPSTKPRPMNSMVSVAMKAGTFRMVTSTPLIRPISVPSSRQTSDRRRRCRDRDRSARTAIEKTTRDQAVGRADRQVEVLVDDDEGHADRHHAEARRCRAAPRGSASVEPKKAGLTKAPPR